MRLGNFQLRSKLAGTLRREVNALSREYRLELPGRLNLMCDAVDEAGGRMGKLRQKER